MTTMPQGKKIPGELRRTVLRMAEHGEKTKKISLYTDVSTREIYRILALHRTTGNVETSRGNALDLRGRRRALDADEIDVRPRLSFVSFTHLQV